MKSIWEEITNGEPAPALNENISRDIVVIGGGIAGILVAYQLTQRGENVTLVEADRLFGGVTNNTTAHITSQQGYIYSDLVKSQSLEFAKRYFESQEQAIGEYEKIVKKHKIDCDFERVDAYLFSTDNHKKIEKEYRALLNIGANVELCDSVPAIKNEKLIAIKLPNQATFHPTKFLVGLPKKFEIFENTRIVKVDLKHKILYTEQNKIQAKKIVIATNYPIVNVRGGYFLKLHKSQSYAIATGVSMDLHAMLHDDKDDGYTYRSLGKQVIIGGLDHRTGRINANDKFTILEEKARKIFGKIIIKNKWTANDVITFDKVPYVGNFTNKFDEIFVVTGFNKWGMANAMISSIIIADMITGNVNRFAPVFCPQRKSFSIGHFLVSMGVVAKNLLLDPLIIPLSSYKSIPPDSGKIVFYKGIKKAVYKDSDGNIYACSPFCKHLGCQLSFNENAKTWDCPCHGSRYDIHGDIITCPTVENLNVHDNKN